MGMDFVNNLAANNIIDYNLASKVNRSFGTTTMGNRGTYNAYARVGTTDTFTRSAQEKQMMAKGGLITGAIALAGVAISKFGKKSKKGATGVKGLFSKLFNKKAVATAAETAGAGAAGAGAAAGAQTAAKEAKGLKKVLKAIPKPLKVIAGVVAGGALLLNGAKKVMVKKYMQQNQAAMQAQAQTQGAAQTESQTLTPEQAQALAKADAQLKTYQA